MRASALFAGASIMRMSTLPSPAMHRMMRRATACGAVTNPERSPIVATQLQHRQRYGGGCHFCLTIVPAYSADRLRRGDSGQADALVPSAALAVQPDFDLRRAPADRPWFHQRDRLREARRVFAAAPRIAWGECSLSPSGKWYGVTGRHLIDECCSSSPSTTLMAAQRAAARAE